MVSDLSNYLNKTVTDVYKLDLMPIINRDIRGRSCSKEYHNCTDSNGFLLRDVFCDGLVTISKDKIYSLPCKAKETKFLLWFYMERNGKSFTFTVFAKEANIVSDSLGRNSIATFSVKNTTFILTSGYDDAYMLGLSIYDFSDIINRQVKEIKYQIYTNLNFTSAQNSLSILNIRDIKSFSPVFSSDSTSKRKNRSHFAIVSCFNNGLMFFKGINLNLTTFENPISEEISYLQFSYAYNISGLGKVFTEKEYFNETIVEFFFYSSTSYPPILYEFLIDRYLNMNINRIYDANFGGQNRYVGNDMITVNERFIAFLLYDMKNLTQAIRIFYRDETNFGLGHTHVSLLGLKSSISSLKFLSYNRENDIFVINPERWSIERINNYEIIFNLYNKTEEYSIYNCSKLK